MDGKTICWGIVIYQAIWHIGQCAYAYLPVLQGCIDIISASYSSNSFSSSTPFVQMVETPSIEIWKCPKPQHYLMSFAHISTVNFPNAWPYSDTFLLYVPFICKAKCIVINSLYHFYHIILAVNIHVDSASSAASTLLLCVIELNHIQTGQKWVCWQRLVYTHQFSIKIGSVPNVWRRVWVVL